ncbi:MAG: hypothetical protein ABIV48_10035 [Pyrinomonadaceae bacterium]
MIKKIFVVGMLLAMTFFWIPSDSSAVSAQERRTRVRQDRNTGRQMQSLHQTRRLDRGRKKNAHGYKNYGQYRRTQVGNRRFRVVRQPYYRNGVRLTRLVRVYY